MIGKLLDFSARRPRGIVALSIFRHGELIEQFAERNLIVAGASSVNAALVGGNVANQSITQIGFGTNGTAPVSGNTTLTGGYFKPIDSVSYPAAGQVQFNFSLATTEANGMSIYEFGLLTAGSVLYARKVRAAALNKGSDLSLAGTWTIQF